MAALPSVQQAIREEVARRIEAGEDIAAIDLSKMGKHRKTTKNAA